MRSYPVRLTLLFRTSRGAALDSKEVELVLIDPPVPAASLTLPVRAYGRTFLAPVTIPTVDANGSPYPDGTRFDVEWPSGIEVPPGSVEVATVERDGVPPMRVFKEVYPS